MTYSYDVLLYDVFLIFLLHNLTLPQWGQCTICHIFSSNSDAVRNVAHFWNTCILMDFLLLHVVPLYIVRPLFIIYWSITSSFQQKLSSTNHTHHQLMLEFLQMSGRYCLC